MKWLLWLWQTEGLIPGWLASVQPAVSQGSGATDGEQTVENLTEEDGAVKCDAFMICSANSARQNKNRELSCCFFNPALSFLSFSFFSPTILLFYILPWRVWEVCQADAISCRATGGDGRHFAASFSENTPGRRALYYSLRVNGPLERTGTGLNVWINWLVSTQTQATLCSASLKVRSESLLRRVRRDAPCTRWQHATKTNGSYLGEDLQRAFVCWRFERSIY